MWHINDDHIQNTVSELKVVGGADSEILDLRCVSACVEYNAT